MFDNNEDKPWTPNPEFKRTINQFEAIELVSRGQSLDDHNVVQGNQINMNWKGKDGRTLGECLKKDDSGGGFLIIMEHGGMNLQTTIAYLGSHWSLWRDNMDKIFKKKETK